MAFRDWLGLRVGPAPAAGAAETDTVRRIVAELDHLPPEQASWIAAFAYILSRVARADMKIDDAETRAMERIVVERAGLTEPLAVLVVQMAKTQNLLFGATENYLVTREFNRLASDEQKRALLRCLFAVSAAAGGVSGAEDKVIRQIADELLLEHRDFIEARLASRVVGE